MMMMMRREKSMRSRPFKNPKPRRRMVRELLIVRVCSMMDKPEAKVFFINRKVRELVTYCKGLFFMKCDGQV
jgi:hypothetical protein